MEIKFYELDAVVASFEKLGDIKGLVDWKDILFNKIKSKKALTANLEEFEKDRLEIIKELCKKDEKGEPIVENNEYTFTEENKAKIELALKELTEKTNTKIITVEITPLKLDSFDSIKDKAELVNILEPLVVLNIVNE